MENETLHPDDIFVGDRLRSLNDEKVADLERSIAAIGLQTPITVRLAHAMVIDGEELDEVPVLVAGRHRLQAVKNLGHEWISVVIYGGSEIDARMWEIAENLHRAELTELERSDHVMNGSG
jgi:ParB/RepB/Spo0J family partition protein